MTTEEMQKNLEKVFADRFGGEGNVYASAGRINLIGEHTDYNGGCYRQGHHGRDPSQRA